MLMHHFGAEKHGVQGLVDQKDPKKIFMVLLSSLRLADNLEHKSI